MEALFSELKNQVRLRRLRLRRLKSVRGQFFLAAAGPEHQATRAVSRPIDNCEHRAATFSDWFRVQV